MLLTRPIISASLVERVSSTLLVHLGQVQSAVHTARQLGDVDIEGEFAASQLEHLVVLLVLLQEVDSGADQLAVLAQLPEGERGSVSVDAVLAVVFERLEDAVLCASLFVRADVGRRSLAPVAAALLGGILLVDVMGERVEDNVARLRLAATAPGALESGELGVVLPLALDGSLGRDEGETEEDETEEGRCTSHGCDG